MTKIKSNRIGSFLAGLSVIHYIFITSFGLVVLHSPIADAQNPPPTTTVCTNIGGSTPAEAQVICAHAGTVVVGRAPAPDYYFTFGNQLPDLLEAPPTPPYILTYNLGPGAMGGGIKCPRGYRCTVSWTADGYQITSDLVPKISQNDSEWAKKFWERAAIRAGAGPGLAATLAATIAIIFGLGLEMESAEVAEATHTILERIPVQDLQAATRHWLGLNSSMTRSLLSEFILSTDQARNEGWSPWDNSRISGLGEAVNVYSQSSNLVNALRSGLGLDSIAVSEMNRIIVVWGTRDGMGTLAAFNAEYSGDGKFIFSYEGVQIANGNPNYYTPNLLGQLVGIEYGVQQKSGSLLEVMQWLYDSSNGADGFDFTPFKPPPQ